MEYPAHFEVRRVSRNGGIRWNSNWVNVSSVLAEEYVGLEEIDNDLWNVYFGPLNLGRMNERNLKIEDALGRKRRKKLSPMLPVYLGDESSLLFVAGGVFLSVFLSIGSGRIEAPARLNATVTFSASVNCKILFCVLLSLFLLMLVVPLLYVRIIGGVRIALLLVFAVRKGGDNETEGSKYLKCFHRCSPRSFKCEQLRDRSYRTSDRQ